MRKTLIFISAFTFNLFEMLYYSLPMCIDVASVCLKNNKFRWEIEDEEFLKMLSKEASGEDW